MSDQIDVLEEKLAYLEASNAEMSEEIFRQQQEIAALTKAHHQSIARLQNLEDAEVDAGNGMGAVSMEKPPHY
ncbi:SlyX family protein [bacterium]|nr:SlyX family protein [bacterium]